MNKSIKTILTIFICIVIFLFSNKDISAQEISLTVSPPITEVAIAPGKEVIQTYELKNNGNPTLISVSVVPFHPEGVNGLQKINEELKEGFSSWFSLVQPNIPLEGKFNLPSQALQRINLKISPPPGTALKDYYFLVFFTTGQDSETGLDGGYSQAKVGSNLLITVTDDDKVAKNVQIADFSAPVIIDSFANLNYSVVIENIGRAFVKPQGSVTVSSQPFKSEKKLNLTPVNVLVGSQREILCLEEEEQVNCSPNLKFYLGLYKAKLAFNLDSETQIYSAEVTTIALPFSLTIGLIAIFILLKIVIKITKQGVKEGNN